MKLSVESVSKTFGNRTLFQALSFEAGPDTPVALSGPSGSGKTTLLRMILGLESCDAGRIRFADFASDAPRFGVVFQENRLFEDFSVLENILCVSPPVPQARILEDLERLLPELRPDEPVWKLSGGEKRRLCLIRACRSVSDVWILDEPFAGLDAENRDRCLSYLTELREGRPLICALHRQDIPSGFSTVCLQDEEKDEAERAE